MHYIATSFTEVYSHMQKDSRDEERKKEHFSKGQLKLLFNLYQKCSELLLRMESQQSTGLSTQ